MDEAIQHVVEDWKPDAGVLLGFPCVFSQFHAIVRDIKREKLDSGSAFRALSRMRKAARWTLFTPCIAEQAVRPVDMLTPSPY